MREGGQRGEHLEGARGREPAVHVSGGQDPPSCRVGDDERSRGGLWQWWHVRGGLRRHLWHQHADADDQRGRREQGCACHDAPGK